MGIRSYISLLLICIVALSYSNMLSIDGTVAVGQEASSGGRLVFAEDLTAQWCVYCPSASENLLELSGIRDDLRFVCLIDDMVQEAADRNDDYNPAGYPTVVFDGGYENQVGGVSSTEPYDEKVNACQAREGVPDISVDVTCLYIGDATLSISIELSNNDASEYSGTLKVYVVEEISRFTDYDGNRYPYGLLGFALDEEVTVPPGGQFSGSTEWVGGEHTSLSGGDFSDIDPENIVIYGVAFSSRTNVNYYPGIPPKPYTAHYSDAVGEAFPVETSGMPGVEITSPRDGSSVEKEIEITAIADSDALIEKVEVKLGQEGWLAMGPSGGYYSHVADVSDHTNGDLRITVRATDEFGLTGLDSITVRVENEDFIQGPEIGELTHSPPSPTADDIITILAPVEEYDTSVTSVELTYCLDGTCSMPITMTGVGPGLYSIEIGPFQEDTEVSYSVMVKDDRGNVVTSSEYVFIILPGEEEAAVDDEPQDAGTTTSEADSILTLPLVIGMAAVGAALIVIVYLVTRSKGEY